VKPRVLSLYPLFGWCRQAKLHGLINMYLATVESVQAQLASLPAQEVTPLSPSESAYANGEFCTELVGYPLVAHCPSTMLVCCLCGCECQCPCMSLCWHVHAPAVLV
jgi:hypothetical protein